MMTWGCSFLGSRCMRLLRHSSSIARQQATCCRRCPLLPLHSRLLATSQSEQPAGGRDLRSPTASLDPIRRPVGFPDKLYWRVELELRSHDPAVLDSYTKFLKLAASHLDVTVGKIYDLPRHFHRQSLLKSVHIFGKHKVQYETRTYFRVVELHRLTGSTADTYLEYTQRMLAEGIAMKVTRHAREPMPEHLTQRSDTQSAADSDSPRQQESDTQSAADSDSPRQQEFDTQSAADSDSPRQQESDTQSAADSDSPRQQESDTQSAADSDSPRQQESDTQQPT